MSAHDLINAEPWVSEAACGGIVDPYSDPETFFPLGEARKQRSYYDASADARAVCARCPVTAECLTYALEHDQRHGIWGGYDEHERELLKRRRPE